MALRQYGRGVNDTAEGVGVSFNAEPDYTELGARDREASPLYPPLRVRGSPKDQYAYKHHPAWQDRAIDNTIHDELGPHVDKVLYQASLNGAYRRGADHPYQLAERMVPLGLIGDDILMTEGTSKDGVIKATGKYTMPNTGTETLNDGTFFYYDYPPSEEGMMYAGGCSRMEHVPDGYLCLWTQPWHPDLHRCVPIGLQWALDQKDVKSSNYGQYLNARGLVQATASAAITFLGVLAQDNTFNAAFLRKSGGAFANVLDALIESLRDERSRLDVKPELIEAFTKHWLAPLGISKSKDAATTSNILFNDEVRIGPVFPQADWFDADVPRGESLYRGGSAFIPSSILSQNVRGFDQTAYVPRPAALSARVGEISESGGNYKNFIAHHQITSSENLCYYANRANTFYTRRIGGMTRTSAAPAKEMDVLLLGPFGRFM